MFVFFKAGRKCTCMSSLAYKAASKCCPMHINGIDFNFNNNPSNFVVQLSAVNAN